MKILNFKIQSTLKPRVFDRHWLASEEAFENGLLICSRISHAFGGRLLRQTVKTVEDEPNSSSLIEF